MKKILLISLVFLMILSSCTPKTISDNNNDKPQDDLPQDDIVFDEIGRIEFHTSDELKEFFTVLSTFDGNVFEWADKKWGDKKISPDTAKKLLEFKDCKIPFSPKNLVNGEYDQCEAFVCLVWDSSTNLYRLGIHGEEETNYNIYKEIPPDKLDNMNAFSKNPNKIKVEIDDENFFVAIEDEYLYRGYFAVDDYTVEISIMRKYYVEDGLKDFEKKQYRFFSIDELDYVYDPDYWESV